jgi:hypothetical protein
MKKLLLLPLILLISCANNGKITDFDKYHDVDNYHFNNIEGIDFVILHYEPNDKWVHELLFKNGVPADLTKIDLENINELLQMAVNNYNILKEPRNKDIDLSKYNRQYIAILNENGEKEVYVNCFKNSHVRKDEYWKSDLYIVMDGGSAYFKVKINLTKGFYYNFSVNGYA